MDPNLIHAARRHASAAAEAALVDRVRITREGTQLYSGKAAMRFTGRTEITESAVGGSSVFQFAELQLPNDAPAFDRGDRIQMIETQSPAMLNRVGYIASSEPVETWSAIQRLEIRLEGSLSLGGGI